MGGYYEKSRDGVNWTKLSAADVRSQLAGFYRDVTYAMSEMRKNPGKTWPTPFASFRYTKQEAR